MKSFTRSALTERAAEFFRLARERQTSCSTIDDLSGPFAEFDLYLALGDPAKALKLLDLLSQQYLCPWGYHSEAIRRYRMLEGAFADPALEALRAGGSGRVYFHARLLSEATSAFEGAVAALQSLPESESRTFELLRWRVNRAFALKDLGRLSEAEPILLEALQFAAEHGNTAWEGTIRSHLGMLYLARGDNARAAEYFEQAYAISHRTSDPLVRESDAHGLAAAYLELGRIDEARALYEAALKLSQTTGDLVWRSSHLLGLGNCEFVIGRTAMAVTWYERVLDVRRQVGRRNLESTALGNLARCDTRLGNFAEAESRATEALEIARDTRIAPSIAHRLGGLADLRRVEARYDEATVLLNEALHAIAELDIDKQQYYASLGEVRLLLGDLPAARRYCERAVSEAPCPRASTYSLLGTIAMRQGDRAAAVAAFERVVRMRTRSMVLEDLDATALAWAGLHVTADGPWRPVKRWYGRAASANAEPGVVKQRQQLLAALFNGDHRIPLELRETGAYERRSSRL